ncbi:leucine-rich repeat receptor-like serine/threonine/tyrosine-protein kinase SOBIR1 [Asparagus officinalis]|uniref:leucine-rich repeat receptor-like serine/threonine/tyrosine-protein kinase SOBIR1 n=1 Tax=Asparagus officinalis TaxID=4686 RepID=UPI00098E3325|nr:leucine-rich repeat receptor-like serine/threonine/tyrosine-protein kinase SOBIR1 [Asparagus officinalis]
MARSSLLLLSSSYSFRLLNSRGSVLFTTRIRLPSRRLSGSLPASVGLSSELRELSLPNNRLSGAFPSEIANCVKLETLNLRNNRLSGEVPIEVSSLLRLRSLDLSSNKLSGDLNFLVHFPNLENLSLADNFFSGRIPSTLSSFRNLVSIDLSGNPNLHGDVPRPGNSLRLRQDKNKNKARNRILGFIAGVLGGMVSAALLMTIFFRASPNSARGRHENSGGPSVFSPIIKNVGDLSFLERDDATASLEIIGRGGCGVVYRAELPNNPGKLIAIKKINKTVDREPGEEESKQLNSSTVPIALSLSTNS